MLVHHVPMKTGSESGYFCIIADIQGSIFQCFCNCPVSLNCGWASVLFIEQDAHELADVFYRGWPEVHLVFNAPSLENSPLRGVNGSSRVSLRCSNSICHFCSEAMVLEDCTPRYQARRLRKFLVSLELVVQ